MFLNRRPKGNRWQPGALLALQQATEEYLVRLFDDSNLNGIRANRMVVAGSLEPG